MNIQKTRLWWPRLLPLLAGTIAVGADAWVVAGFVPDLAADMRVTTAAAGLSVTAFAVTDAIGAPVLAAVTSARRPRTIIVGALVVLAGANAACAISPTYALFMVGRVVAALAACVVTPSAGVLAARVAGPEHRGRALALVIAGLTIATAVGVPAGSLLAQIGSWRTALAGVAALSLAAAMTIRTTAPDLEPGVHRRIRQRLAPLTDRRVLAVLGLTVLGMSAAYLPYAYTSILVPEGAAGWLAITLACYGIGAVAGSLGSGRLTDTIGPTRTLTMAYTVMAASFIALATRPGAWIVATAALAWGAASWMQTPPQQHRLLETREDDAPVAIGTNASALYAGVALGNSLGGVLLGAGSRALCLAAAAAAGSALVWNTLLPRFTRRRA